MFSVQLAVSPIGVRCFFVSSRGVDVDHCVKGRHHNDG